MEATTLVHRMPAAFDSDAAGELEATVQCELTQPVFLIIQNGECWSKDGTAERADVTLSITDTDFIALFQGELNAMTAFMTGRLKLDGNLLLAQRIISLFDLEKIRTGP